MQYAIREKNNMQELTLQEFQEINESDLACIFSEAGSIMEPDFDYD